MARSTVQESVAKVAACNCQQKLQFIQSEGFPPLLSHSDERRFNNTTLPRKRDIATFYQDSSDRLLKRASVQAGISQLQLDILSIQDNEDRPPFTYAQLISMAIRSAPNQRLTVAQIYTWISSTFAFYRKDKTQRWQNLVRQNLSRAEAFAKVERPEADDGLGCYWVIRDEKDPGFLRKGCQNPGFAAQLSFLPKLSAKTGTSIPPSQPGVLYSQPSQRPCLMKKASVTGPSLAQPSSEAPVSGSGHALSKDEAIDRRCIDSLTAQCPGTGLPHSSAPFRGQTRVHETTLVRKMPLSHEWQSIKTDNDSRCLSAANAPSLGLHDQDAARITESPCNEGTKRRMKDFCSSTDGDTSLPCENRSLGGVAPRRNVRSLSSGGQSWVRPGMPTRKATNPGPPQQGLGSSWSGLEPTGQPHVLKSQNFPDDQTTTDSFGYGVPLHPLNEHLDHTSQSILYASKPEYGTPRGSENISNARISVPPQYSLAETPNETLQRLMVERNMPQFGRVVHENSYAESGLSDIEIRKNQEFDDGFDLCKGFGKIGASLTQGSTRELGRSSLRPPGAGWGL